MLKGSKDFFISVERDPYKKKNNKMIQDQEERKFFENSMCPECKSGEVYYRVNTKDYRCKKCDCQFFYKDNKYIIIQSITGQDLNKLIEFYHKVTAYYDSVSSIVIEDENKEVYDKIKKMLKHKRGFIVWEGKK